MRAALARALATVGGFGDLLPAPGTTVGSLTGVLLYWGASHLWPHATWPVAIGGVAFLVPLSVWACGIEAARRGHSDPGPVVLDEVAGQWLALAVVALLRSRPPDPSELVTAFLLFRLLDVAKPWPIRKLERLPGGWGIVADDLAAAFAAGLLVPGVLALL
jgi:phosphatidylglycerophosphatase A